MLAQAGASAAEAGRDLGEEDQSIITRCVQEAFFDARQRGEQPPLLEDFYNKLLEQPEPEAKTIALRYERFVTGAQSFFNHQSKEAGAHNLHEQKKNFPPGIFGKEVRCASCGKILTKGKTLRKTGYERTLFCPTRKKSPSHCKGAFISEKHLESAILHELKNLADRYSNDRVQIGICQDAQAVDLIQEKNRLKTAVELIEKEITAYEQRSRDLYLKRATDGMSIDDFNSALSRIRNDVDKLRLKSKRASSELLHLNESIAAESIRMETVLKAADFNRLDKTKVSMLIESVYVHKRDPKSGTQAIDITWKF